MLGPVEVRRNGRVVSVPTGKTAELLVRLAVDAGLPVHADRLVEDLWAADAVRTRRNTLQSKVSQLRRALGDPAVISGGDGSYTLAVDPSEVDALAVLQQTTEATRLLGIGDDRRAGELCGATLAMFRGDVLGGAGEWAAPHRARLEAARLTLVETGLAARMQLGEDGDVIGDVEAAIAAHPFQESLWVLLITALYRAGRQADALAAYRRVRDLLAEELGLVPGPQLRQIEHQVLVQDESLDVAARSADGRHSSGREPAVVVVRARRPPSGARRRLRAARHADGWSRSSDQVVSERQRSPSPPAERCVGPEACGWPGSRWRRRRTMSSTPSSPR